VSVDRHKPPYKVAGAASVGELQLSGARSAEIATLLPVVPVAP